MPINNSFADIFQILDMLFSMRINRYHQLGFCYDSSGAHVSVEVALQQRLQPIYSPYVAVDTSHELPALPPAKVDPAILLYSIERCRVCNRHFTVCNRTKLIN